MQHCPSPLDFRQDVLYLGRPGERPGVAVVVCDESLNGGDEVGNALEDAPAEPLGRELPEPPLDEIQPRTAGRNKVHVEARVAGEPALDRGVCMGGVVVHDQVEVAVWRGLRVNQPEEPEPLLVPMLGQARADEVPRQELQGGEERGRAVPFVVVGHGAAPALPEREAGLGAVERLDLALLVSAQHQRALGGMQVQSHHIGQLLEESPVAAHLERVDPIRLQAVGLPDPVHGFRAHADLDRQGPRTPVGGGGRRTRGRQGDDALQDRRGDGGRPARSRGIPLDPGQPLLGEASPPPAHTFAIRVQGPGDLVVPLPRRRAQDDLRPAHEARGGAPSSCPAFQDGAFLRAQHNRHRHTHGLLLLTEEHTRVRIISHRIYDTLD